MSRSADSVESVRVQRPEGRSAVVLVCEHASAHIPLAYGDLGLSADVQQSHVAWDPGALAVAEAMSEALDAVLVAGCVSRLVYDCNRPPDAPDAMPARSEAFDIPGNAGLTPAEKAARVRAIYAPFRQALAREVAAKPDPVLVTVHSFTPVFHGKPRRDEIGILHDRDSRLADAMLAEAAGQERFRAARNVPYGPEDGVTHTLREHALPHGHRNVMLELRNDLIATPAAQRGMADMLCGWVTAALARIEATPCKV